MKNNFDIVSNTPEPSDLQMDELFIAVFGEPRRDAEMLSWDNLEFDSRYRVIRCKTCGRPKQLYTCR